MEKFWDIKYFYGFKSFKFFKVYLTPEDVNLQKYYSKRDEIIGQEVNVVQINGLRAFTKYRIGVSAFTLVGEGPSNKNYIVLTAGDGKIFKLILIKFKFPANHLMFRLIIKAIRKCV